MATTVTQNPYKITLSSTSEHEYDLSTVIEKLGFNSGWVLIDELSASTQFSVNGVAIDSSSGTWAAGSKPMLPIKKEYFLKVKGSNAATLTITVTPP
jgi:hypothetical protein